MSTGTASLLALSSRSTGISLVTAAYHTQRPVLFVTNLALAIVNAGFALSFLAGAI